MLPLFSICWEVISELDLLISPATLRFQPEPKEGNTGRKSQAYRWRSSYLIKYPSNQSGFPGSSVIKNTPANAGDVGSIPGLGRSPGKGNGSWLQYSCLENPMDRGSQWVAVHGVTKSQTLVSDWAHSTTIIPAARMELGRYIHPTPWPMSSLLGAWRHWTLADCPGFMVLPKGQDHNFSLVGSETDIKCAFCLLFSQRDWAAPKLCARILGKPWISLFPLNMTGFSKWLETSNLQLDAGYKKKEKKLSTGWIKLNFAWLKGKSTQDSKVQSEFQTP